MPGETRKTLREQVVSNLMEGREDDLEFTSDGLGVTMPFSLARALTEQGWTFDDVARVDEGVGARLALFPSQTKERTDVALCAPAPSRLVRLELMYDGRPDATKHARLAAASALTDERDIRGALFELGNAIALGARPQVSEAMEEVLAGLETLGVCPGALKMYARAMRMGRPAPAASRVPSVAEAERAPAPAAEAARDASAKAAAEQEQYGGRSRNDAPAVEAREKEPPQAHGAEVPESQDSPDDLPASAESRRAEELVASVEEAGLAVTPAALEASRKSCESEEGRGGMGVNFLTEERMDALMGALQGACDLADKGEQATSTLGSCVCQMRLPLACGLYVSHDEGAERPVRSVVVSVGGGEGARTSFTATRYRSLAAAVSQFIYPTLLTPVAAQQADEAFFSRTQGESQAWRRLWEGNCMAYNARAGMAVVVDNGDPEATARGFKWVYVDASVSPGELGRAASEGRAVDLLEDDHMVTFDLPAKPGGGFEDFACDLTRLEACIASDEGSWVVGGDREIERACQDRLQEMRAEEAIVEREGARG